MAFIYALADSWTNAAVTYTGIGLNVTDTASAAGSLLMDLQVGGLSAFRVSKTGSPLASGTFILQVAASDTNRTTILNSTGVAIRQNSTFGWGGAIDAGGAPVLMLAFDAANTLAQRNGVNAQAFRVYNTFTDASNYERAKITWASNVLQIGTEKAGTGTARNLELQTDGTTRLTIDANGQTFVSGNFGSLSGTLNIVSGGARNVFLTGTSFILRSTMSTIQMGSDGTGANPDLDLRRMGAGLLRLSQNGANIGAALEFIEQTAPAAPATNSVYIYAEDNGAGKTRLMARFATGAAVQIAIEP